MATCTLTVANAGPADPRFVRAVLELPRQFWRVSATGGGWRFGDDGRWFGHEDLWFVGSLVPGSSASFAVSFRPAGPGDGSVRAVAWSVSPDPDYANNLATATVVVTGGR